ncbi:MAG: asparagine synthase-related protein, partial [Actinomycetota bacterium]|nr:asparagine synthase-related protein [Actinomycetota bacterium]
MLAGPAVSCAMTPLERAWGVVLGPEPATLALRATDNSSGPLASLECLVTRALRRPPCLVSFSGGRDSSTVLAVAAAVARSQGLPLPIPATNRFPQVPATDERAWQEQVIRHLALDDWVRLDHTDELDLIGPYARRVLDSHGVIWPINAHFHAPLAQAASGGSLLTGFGGDEVFSPGRWSRTALVARGRLRPRPGDARGAAAALA